MQILLFKHGQRVAVIGQNGQGKSTLFKIIMKAVEPDSGEIAIDRIYKNRDARPTTKIQSKFECKRCY